MPHNAKQHLILIDFWSTLFYNERYSHGLKKTCGEIQRKY